MEELEITAWTRSETGKGPSRRLRKAGYVPAVLYGAAGAAVNLKLDSKDLARTLGATSWESALINLRGEAGDRKVMIKDLQVHPVRDVIEHIDLYEVRMDEAVTVEVPVRIVGRSAGAREGGIEHMDLRTVTIECLPGLIPEAVDVDVTALGVGESLHIGDLNLPEGVRAVDDPSHVVVSVVPPVKEVETVSAEEAESEIAESFEEKEGGE
ncbi:MAG TPA: 50S ribosomal protein L25 [Deltaproteobacteria bacterium]|nr:50S ribosomal protein L25 [Deltaproteobacteria bacterium]